MIKITHKDLDKFANEHYLAIKDYIENHSRKYTIKKIDEEIENCFGEKWDLKKIILAKPSELEFLTTIYKGKYCKNFGYFETLYNYFTAKNKFQLNTRPYNAYELIKKLNIIVCPYCDRNTIYNLKYSSKRTSELDHFYPKSKYPFLAISFYNLVASCKICNHIKRDNDKKNYINPYDTRFDMNKNAKFSIKIYNSNFYTSTSNFKLTCKIDKKILIDEKERIKNNIKDFQLFDLYQNHKDIVLETIQKQIVYNDSYIEELMRNYDGTLFKNEGDLMRLISCGYGSEEDIGKRPLLKLIGDISKELDFV